MGIGERHEVRFVEIGDDENYVHLLIQGIPVRESSLLSRSLSGLPLFYSTFLNIRVNGKGIL